MRGCPQLLDIVMSLRLELHLGVSVASAIEKILSGGSDPLRRALRLWFCRMAAGQSAESVTMSLPLLAQTPGRQTFLLILERGLRGAPVEQALKDLETELLFTLENLFEKRLQLLPIQMLVPLTLLILPGIGLLLLGPIFLMITGGL